MNWTEIVFCGELWLSQRPPELLVVSLEQDHFKRRE